MRTLLAASMLLCAAARAQDGGKPAPVLSGTGVSAPAAPERPELLVFKGTLLLNEFVYRTVLQLPKDATATVQNARLVAEELAAFLGDAGYDLAKVRTQVKGEQIEVQIDEGALDKIIVAGTGWLGALRFRAALNLPLDVFNRRMFDLQMPRLARDFGWKSYRYELWPVQLQASDNSQMLGDISELRAMPLIRPARGYELRIFAQGEPWGSGFAPEIILNGSIGYGIGGRYRLKDILQAGDRWQMHFRVGGRLTSYLDDSTHVVNSNDYFSTRWLSRAWGGSSRGLRMTVVPRIELWTLQRKDLLLDSFRVLTVEAPVGAGANLTPEYSLFFTGGIQRRWFFDKLSPTPQLLIDDVMSVPLVSNRAFLRATTQYTFNPEELRQDVRNFAALELNVYQPLEGHHGYFRLEATGRRIFPFGWNELRVGFHLSEELGNVIFTDEISLDDHLRIGFGLAKFTRRIGTLSFEFRYSLLRDKVKVGLFSDVAVWRHLPRDDPETTSELAGSSGAGAFFFLMDELQLDAFYGVGWSTDGYIHNGLALSIKEAF